MCRACVRAHAREGNGECEDERPSKRAAKRSEREKGMSERKEGELQHLELAVGRTVGKVGSVLREDFDALDVTLHGSSHSRRLSVLCATPQHHVLEQTTNFTTSPLCSTGGFTSTTSFWPSRIGSETLRALWQWDALPGKES